MHFIQYGFPLNTYFVSVSHGKETKIVSNILKAYIMFYNCSSKHASCEVTTWMTCLEVISLLRVVMLC